MCFKAIWNWIRGYDTQEENMIVFPLTNTVQVNDYIKSIVPVESTICEGIYRNTMEDDTQDIHGFYGNPLWDSDDQLIGYSVIEECEIINYDDKGKPVDGYFKLKISIDPNNGYVYEKQGVDVEYVGYNYMNNPDYENYLALKIYRSEY